MKNSVFKLSILLIVCFVSFASCKKKEYAGFVVDKGMIQFPVNEDYIASGIDKLSFPIELYKLLESNINEIADVYNSFSGVSVKELKRLDSIRDGIGSLYYLTWISDGKNEDIKEIENGLSRLGADKKLIRSVINQAYDAIDKGNYELLYGISRFANELEESLSDVISAIKLCTNYKNGDSWFISMKDVFEHSRKESGESIACIEKYFPSVSFVSGYTDTEYYKTDNK